MEREEQAAHDFLVMPFAEVSTRRAGRTLFYFSFSCCYFPFHPKYRTHTCSVKSPCTIFWNRRNCERYFLRSWGAKQDPSSSSPLSSTYSFTHTHYTISDQHHLTFHTYIHLHTYSTPCSHQGTRRSGNSCRPIHSQ